MTHLDLARALAFVRERTANDGPWVEAIQRVTGNRPPDPWCASFVSFCLAIAHGGASPLPMTASCDVLLAHARKTGRLTSEPKPGDVFLVLRTPTDAIHTGFVTAVAPTAVQTIEGNTNPSGGRDGYGVFARTRTRSPRLVYISLGGS